MRKKMRRNFFWTSAFIFFLLILFFGFYALPSPYQYQHIIWGVTFSSLQAQALGLNPKETLQNIISDLHPAKIRLVAYWDLLEPSKGEYDFSDVDWQIKMAGEFKIPVILAIGMKVPRWPECHIPSWASAMAMEERELSLKNYEKKLILHFINDKNIIIWQVENEPYLSFGLCPARGKNFLEEEITLIKSLDSSRSVLVTDSGELGLWFKSMKEGDEFGTTLYRKTIPSFLNRFGIQFEYPLPPSFYYYKKKIIQFLTGTSQHPTIIVELQGEPWVTHGILKTPVSKQIEYFSSSYLIDTARYARKTGFQEIYFWGAEWWWWMKSKQNHPEYWNEAEKIFVSN